MISEDYLHLGDSGLCMSPLSQRGVPNGSPLRDRSEMGLLMACDLWAHEDSDNGEDLMMHSQAHLLDVHDGGADSTAAEDWKIGSGASWKSCSYRDVLRLGGSQEVCLGF